MISIDYSTISRIARCPKAYQLDRIIEIPAPVSVPLFLGGSFHLVMKTYFNSRLAGVELSADDLVEVFNSFFTSQTAAQGRPVDWNREKEYDVAELGKSLVKAYYPYAQKLQPLLVEQRFEKQTEFCIVYGTIDILVTTGSVIDYKTSAYFPYQNEIDSDLQPTVYSFLLGGAVDFQYHYIIKSKIPVVRIYPTKRSEADFEFFEHSLLPPVVRMINANCFPPLGKANGSCRLCAHNGYCGTYQ